MSESPPIVEKLLEHECFWRDHQKWLAASGYMLRPRYMPDWVPSWVEKNITDDWVLCEDSVVPVNGHFVLDATRISDGRLVALKRLDVTVHPYEVEITQMLGASNLFHHPRNHSVPLYDVLYPPDDPNLAILVIPFLRHFDDPRFDTIGEIVEFFREIFEGLQFMHSLHIAHRDINSMNVMMDASSMYPESFHPLAPSRKRDYTVRAKHYTRTRRPPKYYIIDFGLSCQYDPANGPPQDYPIRGGDKSVPEFQGNGVYKLYNPFPTDVYYLGNMVRRAFLDGDIIHKPKLGLDFMRPLVADMIQDDPTKRPTMNEVVTRFEEILRSLSSWTLRSRVAIGPHDYAIVGCYRAVPHWIRRIKYIFRRYPALPSP